ncbi:MAG: hypothetical protein Q4C49_12370 [Bacillota bacterium]|nr:hypothetical protein [Bacillota bacterium]
MQLRSKYYTYPVIVEGGDFYVDSYFKTDANKEMIGFDIKFTLEADLKNPQLEQLLEEEKVLIVHHIECPQTCLRLIIKTKEKKMQRVISNADVNGIVQICSFLVANEDLHKYTNDYFSPDYKGFKFEIEKGCVMAVGDQINFRINKVKDDLANKSSIFSIMPNMDENATNMQIDLTGQKIAILLPKETFSIYKNMEETSEVQQAMHQMLIVPALMYVFSELKSSKEQLFMYENQRWFRNLKKTCEKIGTPINEDTLDNINIVELSQLVIGNPIVGGMKVMAGTGDNYEG